MGETDRQTETESATVRDSERHRETATERQRETATKRQRETTTERQTVRASHIIVFIIQFDMAAQYAEEQISHNCEIVSVHSTALSNDAVFLQNGKCKSWRE